MSKKIVFLILFICLFGCSKNNNTDNQVDTIIEVHENVIIAINTPNTGIKKLDKAINNYTKNEYKNFIKTYQNINILNQKSELNIDYSYNFISNRYINIAIYEYINSSSLAYPINNIKTFVYDKEKNLFLSIEDIIDKDNYNKLFSTIDNHLNKDYKNCLNKKLNLKDVDRFVFNDQSITFYFSSTNTNCDIITITIPLKDIPLSINIKSDISKKDIPTYKEKYKTIDPTKPVVALTFDDGPSKYTKKIIEFLEENNACATFFILGNKVPIYEQTLKDILKKGNEIGNHSYSHKWLSRLNEVELKNEIEQVQTIVKERLNYDIKYLRPTYGGINKKLRNSTNLEIVLWNIDTMDWKIKNSSQIVSRVINKISNGDIILMHDTYDRTYKAVKKIVPELQSRGYQFVTISELKEYQLLNDNLESH